MSVEEILDIYTRDGKYLGTKTRKECHSENPGYYHKPVWIWIVNDNGEFLVQKRANSKKWFPGYWDIPSAGHLDAGEKSIDGAIRETKEELGIETKPEDYKFIGEYISDTTWEIGQVYLLKINNKTEDMKLQEEEVRRVKWADQEEILKMLQEGIFIPYHKALIELLFWMRDHEGAHTHIGKRT